MTETALAKTGNGAQIVKVGQYPLNQILEQQLYKSAELAQVANVLFPVTALDQIQPLHKPSLSVIQVNTAQTSKDTYFISGQQLGLSKHVILKMLKAAGACVRTQKLTLDSDLDRIRYTAIVWGKLPDGTMHQEQATKFWSWEKCQEDFIRKALAKGKSKEEGLRNALQYREFADEQTETKAILRAARAWLNLQTSYSREELSKPFLIARSVPDIDLSDPEIKRMATQRMLDSTFALYGAPAEAPMLPPVDMGAVPDEPGDEEYDTEDEVAPWETTGDVTDAAFRTDECTSTAKPPVNTKLQRLCIMCGEVFKTDAELRAWLISEFDVTSRKELTNDQLSQAIDKLNRLIDSRLSAPDTSAGAGGDDIDSKLRAIEQELGSDTFIKVLSKLGKTSLEGCTPAVKKAALNYALDVQKGEIEL